MPPTQIPPLRSIILGRCLCHRFSPQRPPRFPPNAGITSASTIPPPHPQWRRFRLSYVWYGLVLGAGSSLGLLIRNFAAPPAGPIPGSQSDETILNSLKKDIDNLDIVKFLRAGIAEREEASEQGLRVGSRGWVELEGRLLGESRGDGAQKKTRTLTQESMTGSGGLGIQKAFWNADTGEMVAVVWIGASLSGWPGVAHGGAICTIFEELMLRMVAGPEKTLDSVPAPTSMRITYAKPTNSTNLYTLRGSFSNPETTQLAPPPDPAQVPKRSWWSWGSFYETSVIAEENRSTEITATLEDSNGALRVRARGTFPVSRDR